MKHECGFREFVAFALMAMFGWLLYNNPSDQIIIGALLTAFAASWGFYLGGSKTGSDTAAKNADTVSEQAKANNPPTMDPAPKDVADAADQTADAAVERAAQIKGETG